MLIELTLDDQMLVKQFLNSFSSFISEQELLKDYENDPYLHYLLYLKDKEVVGYLYYSLIYDRIEINQIRVLEKMQRKGIASFLMEKLLKITEKIPVQNITLEVKCDNQKAIGLYQKFGFQKKAIRKGYYHGVDGILMEKEMIK